jgi:hypothetical protein
MAKAKRIGGESYVREDYERAVKAVATKLRRQFETGKYRGWRDGDSEVEIEEIKRLPFFRLERAVGCLWITSPIRAMAVLEFSRADGEGWSWDKAGGPCLLGAAESNMAFDVLAYVTARGWYTPAAVGEEKVRRLVGAWRRAA